MANPTGEEISALAVERLLDAMRECHSAAIQASNGVRVQGVMYNAIHMLTSSIDVLARLLTGAAGYYAGYGPPGARIWSNDRARRISSDKLAPRLRS